MYNTQLRETDSLPRPVVLVEAEDAEELMGLVNKNEEAKVRIELIVEQTRWVSTGTNTNTCLTLLSLTGRRGTPLGNSRAGRKL